MELLEKRKENIGFTMEQLDYKGLISLLRRQTIVNHTIRVKATKNLFETIRDTCIRMIFFNACRYILKTQ